MSEVVSHIDVSNAPAGGWRRSPQGGIEADCYPTRCGVLKYVYPGGKIVRELRLPEEVYQADSLATLAGAPITIDHPRVPGNKVTPENYSGLQKGHIRDNVRPDGQRVAATMRAQAADAVAGVESGKLVEMSCGYDCKLDFVDGGGVHPVYGEYDAIQRNIRYNHVALLEKGRGRAGSEVGLKLDSSAEATGAGTDPGFAASWHEDEVANVPLPTLGGMTTPTSFTAEEVAKSFVSRADHAKAVDALQAKVDELTSQLTTARTDSAAAIAQVAPAEIDKRVMARSALLDSARKIAGDEFKADGLSDNELRLAALKKADPKADFTGKSVDYVAARFDSKLESVTRADASHSQAGSVISGQGGAGDQRASERTDSNGAPGGSKVAESRAKMNERNASAYKQTGT